MNACDNKSLSVITLNYLCSKYQSHLQLECYGMFFILALVVRYNLFPNINGSDEVTNFAQTVYLWHHRML
jgi:hypothetical protein